MKAIGHDTERSRRSCPRLIALPFLGWCIIHPTSVERLSLRPEYQHLSTTSALLIGCFGDQALLSGLFALFSRTASMAIDFAANILMLGLCAFGAAQATD